MSGIAGAIDLAGERPLPQGVLRAMGAAQGHRGPDDEGEVSSDGVSLGCRRLAIVGVADGRQPLSNEDGSIQVVFHGALYDYAEKRRNLEARGHVFHTHADGELVPHLWEDFGVELFTHLQGQFAFVLHDRRQRRVILARDRFGVCPLHWARREGWLYFGSEIKAILASGQIPAEAEPRALNHVFTFFALPGPMTCFRGIQSVLPGHFLDITLDAGRERDVRDRTYWHINFPDRGQEIHGGDLETLVDEFEATMLKAVKRRLVADVPVAAYLSGGIDSGLIVAMASKLRGEPIPTFTIQIGDPELDELSQAQLVGRHVGTTPRVVRCDNTDVMAAYPRLVAAAESPVIDTACAALLLIASEVRRAGFKTALTGEGADEWLASYPWFKVHKLLSLLDIVPGVRVSSFVRKMFLRMSGAPRFPAHWLGQVQELVGGHNGWLDAYGVMSLSKLHFYSPAMKDVMAENQPYADLQLDTAAMARWHPLHRALYLGARVHLPGLLLHSKGDRASMHSGVENRYAFLDEDVYSFLARLHPDWKLRGLTEKFLLRHLAQRWLPHSIAWKRKALFRAPFDCFHGREAPKYVDQLLSEESLRKTGYFDAAAVKKWRVAVNSMRPGSMHRTSVEMGLTGVMSTQLWHHLFLDATLADLPAAVGKFVG